MEKTAGRTVAVLAGMLRLLLGQRGSSCSLSLVAAAVGHT